MKRILLLLGAVCSALSFFGQTTVSGIVIEETPNGKFHPIPFANVYWYGTQAGAVTDTNGYFELLPVESTSRLIISYVGYKSDTIDVEQPDKLTIILKQSNTLDGVDVVYRTKGTEISYMDPLKTETMGEKELYKAACCNLSESFETNPSIDAAYTDAVTGTKQIQMLGLDGKYTQITREQIPDVRGLSAVQGLTYIPGSWVESIQLNKGAGSVANGYESVTGQINVELEKPEESEKWFLNGYLNQGGRSELNVHSTQRFSSKLATTTLLHGSMRPVEIDGNGDGFLDFPTGYHLNGINRWKFNNQRGWEGQAGVRGLTEDRTGGQPDQEALTNPYQVTWRTNRGEAWGKTGYIFPEAKYSSLGFQGAYVYHDHQSKYGNTVYNAQQQSAYFNSLYQSIIGTSMHKYRVGLSLLYDQYDEQVDSLRYKRTEFVPGVFAEYTLTYLERFAMVIGVRGDYHNYYGFFATPRMHVRYEIRSGSVLRASAGRGQRTANVIAENAGLLATSRTWYIQSDSSIQGFGLKPEVAWNFGLNFTQEFTLRYKPGTFSVDAYQTVFENQTVVDLDQHAQEVHVYDLSGRSYATSLQVQADYELRRRLDLRLAYRWYEVKTNLAGSLRDRPFISRHRAFANLAYETISGWKFDYTVQWQGSKRVPSTESNPEVYQRDTRSPDLFLMNAQITKSWKERFDVYLGMENITNVRQSNPIIAADDPYGPYFDSSLIWGPIFGRMTYLGFRLKAKA